MSPSVKITRATAREILDSRGNPTVEADIFVERHEVEYLGRASVPSGASTGAFEAAELRDGGERYNGLGVLRAVGNIREIASAITGLDARDQTLIDMKLIELDGTPNKSRLGANAILAVSIACARACAEALGIPLYKHLGGAFARSLPVPMMNVINGGRHADNALDLQEFMIVPSGAPSFPEGVRMCAEVYRALKNLLKEKGLSTSVGDEGGFAPEISTPDDALALLVESIERAGYKPGTDVSLAIDAAASELYDNNIYVFPGESKSAGKQISRSSGEMVAEWERLAAKHPIISIEDGLAEEDWDGWRLLTERLGEKLHLVGDDLFATNPERLSRGIKEKCANALLVKPNQIGTLTEAFAAASLARKHGMATVISHRSGETEDTFIADMAVAANAEYIKAGAPCRVDRTSKYNRLLRIYEELGAAH